MAGLASHHKYSASGSTGTLACAGKSAMEEGLDESGDKEYAEWGTAAHFLASVCLEDGVSPALYKGRTIVNWSVNGKGVQTFDGDLCPKGSKKVFEAEVDEEMVEVVDFYVASALENREPMDDLYVEWRVVFGLHTKIKGQYGTADLVIVKKNKLGKVVSIWVIDLKTGRKPVYAEQNTQLMLYALGVLAMLSFVEDLSELADINLRIVMPRLDYVDDWKAPMADLMAFVDTYREAVVRSEEAFVSKNVPNMWYDSKEEWERDYLKFSVEGCRWCKAKMAGICPEYARAQLESVDIATASADSYLDDLDDLDSVGTEGVKKVVKVGQLAVINDPEVLAKAELKSRVKTAIANVHSLPIDTVAQLYGATALFDEFRDALASRLHQSLMAGIDVSGWKLVRGRAGNRKWGAASLIERILVESGANTDDLYEKKLISPTTAESLLAKTKPELWAKLQACISRAEGKVSLAPESDNRPRVTPDVTLDDLGE